MKKGVRKCLASLALSFLLSSCASNQNWYRYQGLNFTECGPAVAASAMSFIGVDTSVTEARSYNTSRTFWRLVDIYDYLESMGAEPEWRLVSDYVPDDTDVNGLSVFFNGMHYVMYYRGVRYDPLTRFSSLQKVPAASRFYIHLNRTPVGK